MEIKRILWPTDLSDNAARAMPYATSLAEKYGAALVVLHVQDEVTRFERLAKALSQDDQQRMRSQMQSDIQKGLEEVCAQLGETCPLYEKRIAEGDAAEEIIRFVKHSDIDLVVMATHGAGCSKGFLAGSVADKVVHHAKAPVLAVRCNL